MNHMRRGFKEVSGSVVRRIPWSSVPRRSQSTLLQPFLNYWRSGAREKFRDAGYALPVRVVSAVLLIGTGATIDGYLFQRQNELSRTESFLKKCNKLEERLEELINSSNTFRAISSLMEYERLLSSSKIDDRLENLKNEYRLLQRIYDQLKSLQEEAKSISNGFMLYDTMGARKDRLNTKLERLLLKTDFAIKSNRGIFLAQTGQLGEAEKHLKSAIKYMNKIEAVVVGNWVSACLLGNYALVISYLGDKTDDVNEKYLLYNRSLKMYRKATSIFSSEYVEVDVLLNMSILLRRRFLRLGEADTVCRRAYAYQPTKIDVLNQSAVSQAVSSGDLTMAKNFLIKAIRLTGGSEEERRTRQACFRNNLSYIYSLMGDGKSALVEAEAAVKELEASPECLFNLGVAKYVSGMLEEAQTDFYEVLRHSETDSQRALICCFIGMIHGRLGEPDKAREKFDSAVKYAGQNAVVGMDEYAVYANNFLTLVSDETAKLGTKDTNFKATEPSAFLRISREAAVDPRSILRVNTPEDSQLTLNAATP